jgi:SNF2 family DNA or RNA helicase
LIRYGFLVKHVEKLARLRFSVIALDEAQYFKNPRSRRFAAAAQLVAKQKIALTGTPVENHYGELAALMELTNPKIFPIGLWSRSDANEEKFKILKGAIRPLIIRRTKDDVLPDLPPKEIRTVLLDLSDSQNQLLQGIVDTRVVRQELDGFRTGSSSPRNFQGILVALLRLRQAACHPALLGFVGEGKAAASPKVEYLLKRSGDIITGGHKALVFSQFTAFLRLIAQAFDCAGIPYLYIDGQTANRDELVQRFNGDAAIPFFLIGLRAGGFGLNLASADHCFIMEPWWNAAVENQAIDRVHRIGQKRKVLVERLIMAGSVEEKMLELQEKKLKRLDDVLVSDEAFLSKLTAEDLCGVFYSGLQR